ncbi:Villin-4-like [Asimina triloba]
MELEGKGTEPDVQSKPLKEGTETEQFWDLLGGKTEFPSQKIAREAESNLKVTEIFNFTQDDLMTEDIYILDCHSEIFVWIGKQVESSLRMQALTIGEKFLEYDFLLESLSRETPIFIVKEGGEPSFFTRFFNWDPAKSSVDGNSFQRKLAILKNGVTAALAKPKRRTQASFGGRSGVTDKPSQRSRSMSLTPDRAHARGRSPAFRALAANFENPSARNLSTPPPRVSSLYPKSSTADSSVTAPRSAAIAALTANFELSREHKVPRFGRVSRMSLESTPESESGRNSSMTSGIQSLTLRNDSKDNEAKGEGHPTFPYERLKVSSSDPITGIDATKREASSTGISESSRKVCHHFMLRFW